MHTMPTAAEFGSWCLCAASFVATLYYGMQIVRGLLATGTKQFVTIAALNSARGELLAKIEAACDLTRQEFRNVANEGKEEAKQIMLTNERIDDRLLVFGALINALDMKVERLTTRIEKTNGG